MPIYTSNYNLAQPLVNDPTDADQWGTQLNSNMVLIDTALKGATISKTATYTVLTTDIGTVILADATSGSVTINLPACATAGNGFKLIVKKIDSSANAVTIDPNSSETIEGATTYILSSQYSSASMVTNGTVWYLVGGGSAFNAGDIKISGKSTVDAGWLECDGSAVSRTTYATLFAAIGTTWGVGDGSTTFNLPDTRGEFLRGWDHGRGVDSGRAIGSSQTDDLKAHTHTMTSISPVGSTGSGRTIPATPGDGSTFTTNSTGSTETRPRNVSVMYCIKT